MAGVPRIVNMFVEILKAVSTVTAKIIKRYMACIELGIYTMYIENLRVISPFIQMLFAIESYKVKSAHL